jgi:hypothetical protein
MRHTAATTLELLKELVAHPPQDEVERKQVALAAYDLARAVEPLYDQVQRLVYTNILLPLMTTAVDLKLFQHLSDPIGEPHSTKQLAELTGADEKLLSAGPYRFY